MESSDIGDLLVKAQEGNREAEHRLIAVVYEELRIMAHQHLRNEQGSFTLSTTVLVNEAYVKLVDGKHAPFRSRAYFFGAASRAMRQVIVDLARMRQTQKRGVDHQRITVEIDELAIDVCAEEVLELDEALRDLAMTDQRLSDIVEYRFFGGLTEEQTSGIVGVTARTVRRDWRKARAWLFNHLHKDSSIRKEIEQPEV